MSQPQKVEVSAGVWRPLMTSEKQPAKECCCIDADCCMYPASQLGVGYTPSDLPDSIVMPSDQTTSPFQTWSGTYNRGGSEFIRTDAEYKWTTTGDIAGSWSLEKQDGLGGWENAFDFGDDCLINTTIAGGLAREDEFQDTYTVGAVTLTRASTCKWTGGGRTLRYNSNTYQFELDGVAKSGDQNKPDGTYGAETVSE